MSIHRLSFRHSVIHHSAKNAMKEQNTDCLVCCMRCLPHIGYTDESGGSVITGKNPFQFEGKKP